MLRAWTNGLPVRLKRNNECQRFSEVALIEIGEILRRREEESKDGSKSLDVDSLLNVE